jgi:mono/diheme cytochrome c family protein
MLETLPPVLRLRLAVIPARLANPGTERRGGETLRRAAKATRPSPPRIGVGVGIAIGIGIEEPYDAFLEKHCISCHGPEKEKGTCASTSSRAISRLGADTHHWAEVIEQVNSGEMPPKKEKKPTQEEIAAFVTSLDSRIKEGRAARMAARPAVAHYRLSRKEYQNTVYDLLGVRYDPTKPGELNEDTLWHGFERIGSELSLSPSHVDRYYRAAELVLDRAFPTATARLARSARPRRRCVTAAGRTSRRRWTASASSGRCVTCFSRQRPERALANWFGKTGPGAQRALQTPHPGQRHPPARWSAGAPEHRQADGRGDGGWPHRVRHHGTGGQTAGV